MDCEVTMRTHLRRFRGVTSSPPAAPGPPLVSHRFPHIQVPTATSPSILPPLSSYRNLHHLRFPSSYFSSSIFSADCRRNRSQHIMPHLHNCTPSVSVLGHSCHRLRFSFTLSSRLRGLLLPIPSPSRSNSRPYSVSVGWRPRAFASAGVKTGCVQGMTSSVLHCLYFDLAVAPSLLVLHLTSHSNAFCVSDRGVTSSPPAAPGPPSPAIASLTFKFRPLQYRPTSLHSPATVTSTIPGFHLHLFPPPFSLPIVVVTGPTTSRVTSTIVLRPSLFSVTPATAFDSHSLSLHGSEAFSFRFRHLQGQTPVLCFRGVETESIRLRRSENRLRLRNDLKRSLRSHAYLHQQPPLHKMAGTLTVGAGGQLSSTGFESAYGESSSINDVPTSGPPGVGPNGSAPPMPPVVRLHHCRPRLAKAAWQLVHTTSCSCDQHQLCSPSGWRCGGRGGGSWACKSACPGRSTSRNTARRGAYDA
ncbi:hypothetical protein NL676_009655 [Syzygium grande]|nr:hypothetical protein NL676_009655 [Syzygium grande]